MISISTLLGVEVEIPVPYDFSDIAAIEAQGSELGENRA